MEANNQLLGTEVAFIFQPHTFTETPKERRIITIEAPPRQRERFESVAELLIGLEDTQRVLRADQHDGDLQLIAQGLHRVQINTTLVHLAGEDMVDLVDDEHTHAHLRQQAKHLVVLTVRSRRRKVGRVQPAQDSVVERPDVGDRRRLHHEHR